MAGLGYPGTAWDGVWAARYLSKNRFAFRSSAPLERWIVTKMLRGAKLSRTYGEALRSPAIPATRRMRCHIIETAAEHNGITIKHQTSRSRSKFHVQRRTDTNLCLWSSLSGQRKRFTISSHGSARRNAELHQMRQTQSAQQRQHQAVSECLDVFLF